MQDLTPNPVQILQKPFNVVNYRSMNKTIDILSASRKFSGFKLLEFFLLYPHSEYHLKEIARKAKLSPATVKFYGELFLKYNILREKKIGNQRMFYLNGEDLLVKRFKQTYAGLLIKSISLEKIAPNALTIAVYGSFAKGDFDERSDLDALVIGDKKDLDVEQLRKKEKQIGREIEVSVYSFHMWEKVKKENNPFAKAVLENNIIIKGEGL